MKQKQKKKKENKTKTGGCDTAQKEKMMTRADARDTVKQKHIERGDVVLVKRDGHAAKDVTPYEAVPYQVIATKGTKSPVKDLVIASPEMLSLKCSKKSHLSHFHLHLL